VRVTPSSQGVSPAVDGGLVHKALLYRNAGEYVDGVRRFILPGIEAGEPVVVAVPGPNVELLREGLDGEAGPVRFIDMTRLGRNPGWIIPAVQELLDEHAGTRVHYVGEPIWPGRSEAEMREATRHEALINLAWAGVPVRVLCPYDAAALDPAVIAAAECTHPHVLGDGDERTSALFTGHAPPSGYDEPLPPPPADAETVEIGPSALPGVRAAVSLQAAMAGLDPARTLDAVLVASEVAGNTIEHAGGQGLLSVWPADGNLVCEVRDGGVIEDPLAGRRPPGPAAVRGRGLWLANRLCDLVELRTCPTGTTVRMHFAVR
jgi:anti-sigma regulatory factor (Ser/Thr protein kinase)